MMRRIVIFAALAWCFITPATATAQDLSWDADDRRVGWTEAAVTAGSAAALITFYSVLEEPAEPRWIGPILLDDYARNGLLADGDGVELASALSDVLVVSLMGWTVTIDSIGKAGLANDEWDSALQTSTIAVQSHVLNVLVTSGLKYAIGRQRPGIGRCYDDPTSDPSCADRPNVSFPSGHTSSAFTGAGLICVTHENIPYYGGGLADRVACYAALTAATATGLLRIASNNHYLTDIVAGALIGFSMGYLVPRFVYFSSDEVDATETAIDALAPPPAPVISFGGSF